MLCICFLRKIKIAKNKRKRVAKCDVCGREEDLPYKCPYCRGTFCSDHRLPEKHGCDGLYDIPVRVKRDIPQRVETIKPKRGIFEIYGYNNVILGIITVFFVLSIISDTFFRLFALYPTRFYYMPWQLITSLFMHGSFDHYIVNAIVLFFFGTELERRVGGKDYLKIFLLSGIVGNLCYILFAYATNNLAPAVGASGAIYGVMGTLAVIAPEIRVLLFFVVPVDIRTAIVLFAVYNLLMTPFSIFTGVAYVAHLGGLAFGLYYGSKIKRRRWFY